MAGPAPPSSTSSMVSLSSQGTSGPESGFGSFGSTLEALGGLMALTGYPGESPTWTGVDVNYPDQIAGLLGAGLIVASILQSRDSGSGTYIDLSQRALVTTVIGEAVLDSVVNNRDLQPVGNSSETCAPHGFYQCRGIDQWLAIAIETDAHWSSCCRALGWDELMIDNRFASTTDRLVHWRELDKLIRPLMLLWDKKQALATLQGAGVPTGAEMNARDRYEDPHLSARSWFVPVVHPTAGLQNQRGLPFRLKTAPRPLSRPAPTFDEHTNDVMRDLGYDDRQIEEFRTSGVIGGEIVWPTR